VVLSASSALAIYSVPTMSMGIFGLFAVQLYRRRDLRTMAAALATVITTAALYSPVLATSGPSAITHNQWTQPVPVSEWQRLFWHESASLWRYWNTDVPIVVSVLVSCLGLVGGCYAVSKRSTAIPGTLIAIFVCAAFACRFQLVVPPRRAWLFLLPLWFGTAATGWSYIAGFLSRYRFVVVAVPITVSIAMGSDVLYSKSLRHSGIESVGARSSEAVVLATRNQLVGGAQFICSEPFDSGLDFAMMRNNVRYKPAPGGQLLLVTGVRQSPLEMIAAAGLAPASVRLIQKFASFADMVVYTAERAPGLPFRPHGDARMGVFTRE
jgi:hypothetical protein